LPEKSYFEKIDEIIKKREKELGRKLTIEEQDKAKVQAMNELFIEASKEVKEEEL